VALDLISSVFGTLNTAFDLGKTVGGWIFGTGSKSSGGGPLPAWAAQGTPAYGDWSYAGVPAKRLVYIDRVTGGHRVFGPSQAASLLLADMPPLPKGSLVTLDPEAGKTGVLNPAAVKRALQGCPSAPQQSDQAAPPPVAPVVPPAAAPAPSSPRAEAFWSDLLLNQVPRAATQLAPLFGDLSRPAGNLRVGPRLPYWNSQPWVAQPPPLPDTEGNWTDDRDAPDLIPDDPMAPAEPAQPPVVPPAAGSCGCVMPCCPSQAASRAAPRRQRAKPRLRPNVTIICGGGRKRKL
jgi:hypothetical protein